jgi:hypothetical protein
MMPLTEPCSCNGGKVLIRLGFLSTAPYLPWDTPRDETVGEITCPACNGYGMRPTKDGLNLLTFIRRYGS